ncbi:hypothetical protein CEP54_012698 [Fusarium duplospermum]|uniref:PA14 domain-containing protein n=1 Tax=Fusarium duplospermum TaxID=1325734 RepID=A0A428P728_9HYPO|nr:hypothetical protein CEP54_012698 [Fusarium duplospermum]
MHLRTFVWGSAALLLSSTGLSVADTPGCLKGVQVIELQPYEVICDGTTSASTRTRTYTVPLGTDSPDQPGTPGAPDTPDKPQSPGQPGTPGDSSTPGQPGDPGRPQVPGRPIVPGHPESPNQPGSPPDVPPVSSVTITITGTPPPVKTDVTPPPRGGTRTITVYIFPPPTPRTTTSFVTGGTPGTTTFPPAPGCSGSQCIETVMVTVPGPTPSLTTRTSTIVKTGPPPLDPPNTRVVTTTVPGTIPGTITIPPASTCETSCVETVIITTVPTTPPNTAITLTEVCTATTSCEPTTITPPADCVRPCTTTVITYPPMTFSPTTTTPPDVVTTITESCTATTSCEPTTITPPADCIHPCTTTVITYPPTTASLTTATPPPDVITTITEPCTSTGSCEPIITIPPASDCTHPCTTSVIVRPSSSTSLTTTPPDDITTITEPCPSTGTCEPVVTIPPRSDCTRPCTTSVFVRFSTSSSEAPFTTTDVSSSTEESSSTSETSSAQESTTSEEPTTTTEDPTSSEEPTTTQPAETTAESTTAQESTTSDETTTAAESTTSEEPTTSAQPTTSTEPSTTEAPTSTEESTTSDTPSTTTSETPPCTPGLQWAFYNFEQGTDGTTEPGRIPYHPTERTTTWSEQTFQIGTSLSGQSPGLTGTTTTVGIPSQNEAFTVYGTDTGTDAMYNIVQHIGYFHPNRAGTYTFNLPDRELDDVVYTWLGDSARSGYNNGNAYYIADYYAPTARSFTYDVQNAGDYIPFRLSWVNAQDGGGFGFSVTDPDGNVILSDID